MLAGASAFGQVSQINVSEDLATLGIARQNAIPNTPGLDSRPLFQAAIQYAAANGISKIVADPGAYWFLTPQQSSQYLVLNQLSDLTIDLQGSDIYLGTPFLTGFDLVSCHRVTLSNFTLDFASLPFTQVKLTGVSGRSLAYTTIPGWPSPTTLRSGAGGTAYWGIVLRSGTVPPNTNRLSLALPTDPANLQVNADDSPWTQPAVLNTYQAGDVVVVTLKDGPAAVLAEGGDTITLSGVDVYSSGSLGVQFDTASNSTISNVRVMPRPGTDRLISTNADGIHMSYLQSGNHVQSCYINRTMDDGIALSSEWIAMVNAATSTRTLSINRVNQVRVPNGTAVSLIDPVTGLTTGRYLIVSQNPPYSTTLNYNPTATYTVDSDLPALTNGMGLIYADAANRGQSTVVEKNLIEDILFARGIFLGGVNGVTVQKNLIRRINCGGIVAHQDLAAYPSAANQNLLITGNTIDAAIGPTAVGTGAIAALGSIFVLATDLNFNPLPTPTATNITITNNFIINAGRSGIWAGNISGGSIQSNTISSYDLYPQLAIWGISQSLAAQLVQDFTQAIVVRSSNNLSVQTH